MLRIPIILGGFLTLLTSGCVYTFEPVYSEGDLYFDSELLGVWGRPGSRELLQVTDLGNQSYGILYLDEEGRAARFTARLERVGPIPLLHVHPVVPDPDGVYETHFQSLYSLMVPRITDDRLELHLLDGQKVARALTDFTGVDPWESGGKVILRGPSHQVRSFLGDFLPSADVLDQGEVLYRMTFRTESAP